MCARAPGRGGLDERRSDVGGRRAEVPERADALASAQDAISLWLDTAAEFGDPVPEPKGRPLMLA